MIKYLQKIVNKISKTDPKFFIILFFSIYLVLGIAIVKDYGVSADEPTEKTTSHRQYKSAFSKVLSLFGKESELIGSIDLNQSMLKELRDKNYGTFLHWPLVAIEHSTGFTIDTGDVFLIRHLQTFLYFYLASIVLFLIIKKRTTSNTIAFLGSLFFILSPRFFAESFYNNKDILFASWYIFSIYFSLRFLDKKTTIRAFITSIVFGIAINTRITAIIVPVLLTIWSAVDIALTKKAKLAPILNTLLIPILSIFVYILTIPTAWGNEVQFLTNIFKEFSQYNWWTGSTLYFGKLIPYNRIPWHFTLGYLLVTTPVWYSLLFLGGLITLLKKMFVYIKKPIKFFTSQLFKYDLFMLTLWLAPLIAVIVFKSVLYNSWRHLYFIYGPFIYITALYIYHHKKQLKYLIPISLIALTINAFWIFNNHPYQYLYFNPIARPLAAQNFERDYWGVGTIDMLNHILATDDRPLINISKDDDSFKTISLEINQAQKSRFNIVEDQSEADYVIYWYYNSKESNVIIPGFTKIKDISAGNIKGMSLYQNSSLSTK